MTDDDDPFPKAEAAIRQDGHTLARFTLDRAKHDPVLALAILGAAVDAVLQTIPNRDQRYTMLAEWLEAFEDHTP